MVVVTFAFSNSSEFLFVGSHWLVFFFSFYVFNFNLKIVTNLLAYFIVFWNDTVARLYYI